MISVSNENGKLLKVVALDEQQDQKIHFHPQMGFVSAESMKARSFLRDQSGLRIAEPEFGFQVQLKGLDFELSQLEKCQAKKIEAGKWELVHGNRVFVLNTAGKAQIQPQALISTREEDSESTRWIWLLCAILFLIVGALSFLPKHQAPVEVKPLEAAPVVVKVEQQPKIVAQAVPQPVSQPRNVKPLALQKEQTAKKALTQNLGFLKMVGRKDLTKAVGGLPTPAKQVTAGAGAGGNAGSGGELLVGVGQGLRRVTVGNSGLAGLGGVGTKGAGGGQGGYGEVEMAGAGGRSLSTVPLAQEAVMDGGLDRAVVDATVARYMSQVRACYEEGLKRKPEMIGQVTMAFEINGGGGVNYARVSRSSLGDKDVEDCISMRMMNWKFPNPRGGVNQKVTYPFMLRPVRN